MPIDKVDVKIVSFKKNSAREIVKEAKKYREFTSDSVWALFDKDGYTEHPTAFDIARKSNVNIGYYCILKKQVNHIKNMMI